MRIATVTIRTRFDGSRETGENDECTDTRKLFK
jgi:hypothetical protein